MTVQITLTARQKKAMQYLQSKYGAGGTCSSRANDIFWKENIYGDQKKAAISLTQITSNCREAFDRIVGNDYRELKPEVRKAVMACQELDCPHM